jgi:hypothetical protein
MPSYSGAGEVEAVMPNSSAEAVHILDKDDMIGSFTHHHFVTYHLQWPSFLAFRVLCVLILFHFQGVCSLGDMVRLPP